MSVTKLPVSDARLAANRLNALASTGPKSNLGKATVGQNNFRHGLTSSFSVLAWESAEAYEELRQALRNEHQPPTPTEELLVERMAQHHWLAQRALTLQNGCLESEAITPESERRLALYLRYQTANERAFHKCLGDLAKLQAGRCAELESEQLRRQEEKAREVVEKARRHDPDWIRELKEKREAQELLDRLSRHQLALNRKQARTQPQNPTLPMPEHKITLK